jgi:hypothetical protein
MTGFVPVMWSVWGGFVVLLIAVNLYASRLAKYEEDQIFLGEGSSKEQLAQAAIAEKVSKFQPFKRAALGLVGAMTLFVVGYYILDVIHQFR